jgi:hypothetical protein
VVAVVSAVISTVVTAMIAAAISGELVFTVRVMAGVACVASPIARLVAVEVVELLFAAARQRSAVTVMGIKPVVDMAVKAVRAVEPAASSNKHPVHKPIGPVVAVGCAVIWSVVEVPIGADRLHSEGDGDLGWRYPHTAEQGSCERGEGKGFDFEHNLSLIRFELQGGRGVVSPAHDFNPDH